MRPTNQKGSVLLLTVIALGAVTIVGAGLLLSMQAWSDNSSKEMFQAATQEVMYASTHDLRAYILANLETNATVDLSGIPGASSGMSFIANGNTLFPYAYSGSASGIVNAVNNAPSLSRLSDPRDPFAMALAARTQFIFGQASSLTYASPLATGSVARGFRNMSSAMQIDVRQIPLSQFTLFSSSTTTLTGSIGRVHCGSDAAVMGIAQTDYPLTVAGRISFMTGAGMSVRQTPSGVAMSVTQSTDIATKRVLMKGTMLDQDVGKSRLATALPISGLVAQPSLNLGSSQKNAQKLSGACDVWVYYDAATGQFSSTRPTGQVDSATRNGMALYNGVLAASVNPHPVIEFDLNRLTTQGSTHSKYYIYCSDNSAIVLLRNGEMLPRDISIITPLGVWLDGGWNIPADPADTKATSIVTSGRVQVVDADP